MRGVKNFYLSMVVDGVDAKMLWRRYVLGLALIAALLIGSHAAPSWVVLSAEDDARIINQSGRQRMLSQRILYFAGAQASAPREEFRAPMTAAVALFARSHDELSGDPALSDAARALYFDAEAGPSLDAMVRSYVLDAEVILNPAAGRREKARALRRMERIGPDPLLKRLDRVVKQYEAESNARLAAVGQLQDLGLALAMAILLLEALLIFLPAQIAVRRALGRLETHAEAIEASRRSEAAKNLELEALRSAAEHDAAHDALTGLANRRELERRIHEMIDLRASDEDGVALLHIDLDRFKQINDTLGHAAGDFILQHVARVLQETSEPEDLVARIGGDEFVILRASRGDRRPLEALAGRIVARLSKPVEYEGDLCRFGASVGIDVGIAAHAGPGLTPETVLRNADIALYRSKELGRGRFTFFCDDLRREVERSRALSDELPLALGRGEFFFVYQPMVSAEDGAPIAATALARWRHPEHGVLSPEEFMPLIERLNLAADLDARLLDAALADLAAWEDAGVAPPRLSLPVSAQRLSDPKLAQQLTRCAPPKGRLAFEIRETLFAEALDDQVKAGLELIDELGIALEIDDFGAGGASLSAMLAAAPRRLKLPSALTQALPGGAAETRQIASVIAVAKALGAEVAAKGVETAAQQAALARLGCDALQGALISPPLSAEAFAARAAAAPGAAAAG